MIRSALSRCLVAVALLAPVAVACGGTPKSQVATVKPQDMPAGGDWTGVFYSPTYGSLHLVKEGETVSGKWRTAAGDKWGELVGKVIGNLLKYSWTEHSIGMIGPSATKTGHGYFVYTLPEVEGDEHRIVGEWGLGEDEIGQKWQAVRQHNVVPEPDSVLPDETQKAQVGDDWD